MEDPPIALDLPAPGPAPRPLALTSEERRAWARDGFFVRERAFAPAEVAPLVAAAERVAVRAREAAERAEAAGAAASGDAYAIDGNRYVEALGSTVQYEHRSDTRTLRVIEPFHPLDARLEELLDDPRLVEPMRGLVGSEQVALFTDKLNLKRPREGSGFQWHQDSPYWTHVCDHVDRLPNVMVALDDASIENGCLRVIRGSHTKGCLPGREGEGTLGPLFTHPDHFDESQQVPVEMPAGSLCFFSPHTVHGSRPNESDRLRRALVITYQPGGHPMFKIPAVRACGTAERAPG